MTDQRVWARIKAGAFAAILAAALLVTTQPAGAQEPRGVAGMFTQQDAVQSFNFVTGKGYQVGTATGRISGTTFVSFQFTPSGPPVGDALPITFNNEVIITDIDGDQLFFNNDGTGTFHLGVPGADFRGSGGPLRGTYVLTGATGKYAAEWKVGRTLDYKAILTNPPSPAGALGTVFVQIAARDN